MFASYNSELHSPLPLRTISKNIDKIHFKNQFKGIEELPRQRVNWEVKILEGRETHRIESSIWFLFLP